MNLKTIAQIEKDLQNLADQVGESGFAKAKALYMEKVAVVDEEGTPLSADEIEVVLMPKMAEGKAEPMEEDEEEKSVEAVEAPAAKAAPAPRRKAASVAARMSAPAIARPKVWGSLKNFKSDERGDAVDKAQRFGHWLLASKGNRKSLAFCDRHGIEVKAHTEGVNSAGGFLVPDEFETELISLRERFGVFRREARVRPMSSDTLRVPRRSATLSASFVGEATAGTESTQTFESVLLVAKKAMVLTTVSNELNEDAFVNLADDVAGEIAYAFAKKEDECGFVGDGTSTYGGIQGVASKLLGQTEDVNFVDFGGSTITGLTAAVVSDLMALLPEYADTPNCKFYMHKSTWHLGFENLLLDAGGSSGREIMDGYRGQPSFLGYPVVFTQAMANCANTQSADVIGVVFGDLTQAASFGDRRSTTIQISDSALNAFEQDELAIRGTERFDINVHDTGDSSNAGPVVGLRLDISP
jgi:HK97 family phage major capsid protein